jgi:hypothetical protein
MVRTRLVPLLIVASLAAASLGCSLVGRAVDSATGGAASTLEAVQSELEQALATLPAGIDGAMPTLPVELPGVELPGLGAGGEITDLGGTLSGNLSYPSEGVPALRVVAFDAISGDPAASIETAAGQSSYSLPLPPGVYNIVAYTLDGKLAGGYTIAVLCGLSASCTDHSLVPVPVAGGLEVSDIDPADWYAPEGTFPPAP